MKHPLLFSCILTGLFLAGAASVIAQPAYTTLSTTSKHNVKDYDRAMTMIDLGQLEEAYKLLARTVEDDSLFLDAYIQLGGVRHDQGMLGEAEMYLEKVLALAPDYKKSVWLQLGLIEWRQDKYDQAEEHLKGYLAMNPTNEHDVKLARIYLDRCAFSAAAMRNPVPFQPQKLDSTINTDADEYLPSLTADGGALIFTRVVNHQEDFYLSRPTAEGGWGKAVPIDRVNTDQNEGAQTVSADGRLLIFTACNRPGTVGRCDLYITEYVNGKWTDVKNMGEPVNTRAWESQPSLSADGKTLYFASERSGGKGGKDIWVSYRQADGSWSVPENLGDTINTPEDEQGPFIHADGQTLYFMSDGHPGMGKSDIFYSRLGPDGTWQPPVNMGYPINSKSDEGLLVVSIDGKTAYFASNRANLDPTRSNGRPTYDLYSFELYEAARPKPVTYVKAVVRDADTKALLEGALAQITDLETGQVAVERATDPSGQFLVVLPAGKNYALNVSRSHYLFFSDHFELREPGSVDKPFQLEIELQPIPENGAPAGEKAIVLKNVFFESGSAQLRPESVTELEKLRHLLEDNPGLRIQINGHTDNVGTGADNQTLSEQRAKAVYSYLVEHGIDRGRLRYKGFGESRPVDTNETEEGRQQNRRTEFVVF